MASDFIGGSDAHTNGGVKGSGVKGGRQCRGSCDS